MKRARPFIVGPYHERQDGVNGLPERFHNVKHMSIDSGLRLTFVRRTL